MSLPATTRAIAVYPDHPGAVHRTEIPVPQVGPTGVLVQTIRVGVCGTDREIIHGALGTSPPGSRELVIGHEVLGRVVAVGDQVHDLLAGDLVSATVRRPDGCPACVAGQPDMCIAGDYEERGIVRQHGFMTEYWVEDRAWIVPVPKHLESTGVLIEPLTVVEKAVRQVDLIQERMAWWQPSTVVVLGAGPIGILGTLLLRARGIDVTTVARTPQPNPAASIVEQAGATYVSSREVSLDALRNQRGNIDIVLECSGASTLAFEGMHLLGANGVLVLLSLTDAGRMLEVDAGRINTGIVAGNKTVVGSVNAGHEDFAQAVDDLGRFESLWPGLLNRMFTERLAFDDDVTSIARKDARGIKTLIEFDQTR